MKKDEFESKLLDLWVTTSIPLTEANVQHHTGEPQRKVRKWLEEMVRDGELDVNTSGAVDLTFEMPGAERPADGPRNFAEYNRLRALSAQVTSARADKKAQAARAAEAADARARRERDHEALVAEIEDDEPEKDSGTLDRLRSKYSAGTALSIAQSARNELEKRPDEGNKSLLLSGGLSLVFGPLGWLYAGSFREAIPASLAFVLLVYLLPTFLLLPIAGIGLPISGIAGVVYAWQHNRSGKRDRILGDDDEDKE